MNSIRNRPSAYAAAGHLVMDRGGRLLAIGGAMAKLFPDGLSAPLQDALAPLIAACANGETVSARPLPPGPDGARYLCEIVAIDALQPPGRHYLVTLSRGDAGALAEARFLDNFSHSSRTPLNAILGFADLLGETRLDGYQRHCLQRVESAAQDFLAQLDDLNDLAHIEDGSFAPNLESIDPRQFLTEIAKAHDAVARAKKLRVFCAIDDAVPGVARLDAQRWRRIITQILDDAVSHSADGSIELAADWEPAHQQLLVTVADSATGDGSSRGGGLALAGQVAQALGGDIAFHRWPGTGARVDVAIPLAPAAGGPGLAEAPSSELRILLAEDVPLNQELIKAILMRAGCQVDIVGDGEAAFHAVRERKYDLVLMDMQMPGWDGVRATREIRAMGDDYLALPILALTANVYPEAVHLCREAGMNDHVGKPIRAQELLEKIAKLRPAVTSPATMSFDPEGLRILEELIGPERLAHHLADFRRLIAGILDDLDNLTKDGAALAAQAHRMASTAGNLGLMRLSGLSRQLMRAVAVAEPMALDGLVDDWAQMMRQSDTLLDRWHRVTSPEKIA